MNLVTLESFHSYPIKLEFTQYPAGERGVTILDWDPSGHYTGFTVTCLFKTYQQVIDALLVFNALRNNGFTGPINLYIPYLPSAREDRCENSQSFGLQVTASILNTVEWNSIVTDDVHSNVAAAFFPAGKFTTNSQHECLSGLDQAKAWSERSWESCVLAPDAGAMKKAWEYAKAANVPMLQALKTRDAKTGKLSGFFVPQDVLNYSDVVIADDICDGGGTFIGIADAISQLAKDSGKAKPSLHLRVTHGIFSKGRELLLSVYESVKATHDIDRWGQ